MSPMNTDIKKIAIVRLSALGDIINSAIVLQFIKEHYPQIEIDWITEEVFSPLLEHHPLIKRLHTINLKELKKKRTFSLLKINIQKLRHLGAYDLVIDMQGLLKSAIVSRIISPNTHGFDRESTRESLAALFYKNSSHISYEKSVIKRNTFLVADALGFEISEAMILQKQALFPIKKTFELQEEKKNITFVIGASWKSKIYPKELVVKVCDALQESIYIIWGSEDEKKEAEWIVQNSHHASLAPQCNLSELISFVSAMDLLIGNDTGPTHIAWVQNIPSITLFGPTNARMMYETPKNRAIESNSEVNILKINKNDFSIKDIDYKEIVIQAKELLYGL